MQVLKGKLPTVEEQLGIVLFYLKAYTTYDIVGFIFNLDRSNAYRDINLYRKTLEKTLQCKLVLPTRKITSIDECFKKFPEAKEVCADAYERQPTQAGVMINGWALELSSFLKIVF